MKNADTQKKLEWFYPDIDACQLAMIEEQEQHTNNCSNQIEQACIIQQSITLLQFEQYVFHFY
jgi:hypothetical protein